MSLFFNANDFVSDIGYPLEECGMIELMNDIKEDYLPVIESMYVMHMEKIKYDVITENAFKTFISKIKEFFKQLWGKVKKFFSWIKSLFTGKLKQFKDLTKHQKEIGKFVKDVLSGAYDSGESREQDPVSKEFKEAVEKKDKMGINIMLKNIAMTDPSLWRFNARLKYAEDNMDDFWDEHDGKTYDRHPIKWTNKLYAQVASDLVRNFSKERVDVFKRMTQHLFFDGKGKVTDTKGFFVLDKLPPEVQAQVKGTASKIRMFIQKEKGENANVVEEISKPENLNKYIKENCSVVESIEGDIIKLKGEFPYSMNPDVLNFLQKQLNEVSSDIINYQKLFEKWLIDPKSIGGGITNELDALISDLDLSSGSDFKISNYLASSSLGKQNSYLSKENVLNAEKFSINNKNIISAIEQELSKMQKIETSLIQKSNTNNENELYVASYMKYINSFKTLMLKYIDVNGELSKTCTTCSDLAMKASIDLQSLTEFMK